MYCLALGRPILCPKWDQAKTREFRKRWDFYQRESTGDINEPAQLTSVSEVEDPGKVEMSTRTADA